MFTGFPGDASGKESTCQCRRHKRHRFDPWVGKIPWRRAWQLTAVVLPRESHGQRSLAGYSPWGHTELDMTEQLSFHFTLQRNNSTSDKLWLCLIVYLIHICLFQLGAKKTLHINLWPLLIKYKEYISTI